METNLMTTLGIIIFAIGAIIFAFGKKFILLRAFFGDRSMFSQMFWGTFIAIIGLILLYFGGSFT